MADTNAALVDARKNLSAADLKLERVIDRAQLGDAQLAGVLDSITSEIAVLDSAGKIVHVNKAWMRFGRENGATEETIARKGTDYLSVCNRAAAESPSARKALLGIRAVLENKATEFSMEYECAGPSTTYWFDMIVTPIGDGKVGAVIVHTDATRKAESRHELESALRSESTEKRRAQREQLYLRDEVSRGHGFSEIVGQSPELRSALQAVDDVAATDATVVIQGETGTGKELFARALHSRSERSTQPFVKVDCTTLPPGLVEAELYGHVKGAYTGATNSQPGRFELADGGTIFLDEIGELPLDQQSKLLRVLEEGEIERIGSQKVQKVDVRVVAATNRDLELEVAKGRFRADLFYRLTVFPIRVPTLRERRSDIPLLAKYFVSILSAQIGKRVSSISESALSQLTNYHWPGNVRELRNVIERATILAKGEVLSISGLVSNHGQDTLAADPLTHKEKLENIEREKIIEALSESNWKIKGQRNAAETLGLSPSTLRSKMKRMGIARPAEYSR